MTSPRSWRLENYAQDAKTAIVGAQALADERSHLEVEPLHLLYWLLDRSAYAQQVFEKAGVEPGDALVEAEAVMRRVQQVPNAVAYLSQRMLNLTSRAEDDAKRDGSFVRIRHLLGSLAQEVTGYAGAVLREVGFSDERLRSAVKQVTEPPPGAVPEGSSASSSGGSGGAAAPPGDALQKFTRDLVQAAREGQFDPIVGRDAELRRVLQVLARRQKNNPVLIGEPGVGKRTMVRALAQRIAAGDVPETLKGLRLMQLDMGMLIAGAKLRGELEERLRQVLQSVRESDADVLLFVEDLHTLFSDKGSAGSGPADLLRPALSRGEVQILGTSSPAEYRKSIEKEAGLARLFAAIDVDVPSVDDAIGVVRGIVDRYETYHGVRVSDPAVVSAVKFSKRYLGDRSLPDPAIDLLDEAAALTRLALDTGPSELDVLVRRVSALEAQHRSLADEEDPNSVEARTRMEKELTTAREQLRALQEKWNRQRGLLADVRVKRDKVLEKRRELDSARRVNDGATASRITTQELPEVEEKLKRAEEALAAEGKLLLSPVVTEEGVAKVIEQWTGVPVAKMLEGEQQKLLRMADRLKERVVGQDRAVEVITTAITRGRVGIRDPGKPIGSFFFLGPTGVGKTELAKALAEFLFDNEQALVRLDMSEFMEKHMVARLLGSPPGYVDSEEGGMLTEAVRRQPYSVVLFDEVEKAHPDVFNILLQLLDDGRLTDSRGRLTDFSNTVVIMTSNAGALKIVEATDKGMDEEQLKSLMDQELFKYFRPEFINRIDDKVFFNRLNKQGIRGIVDIQLKRLNRLLVEQRMRLEVSDPAKEELTAQGYEPAFGARPLKRVILKQLQNPLSQELLTGSFRPGETIRVDWKDGRFVFEKVNP